MWVNKDYQPGSEYRVFHDCLCNVKVEHEGTSYVVMDCDALESIRNAPVRANEAIWLYVSTHGNEPLRKALRAVIEAYAQESTRDIRWTRANSSINPHINREHVLSTSPAIVIPDKVGDDDVDRIIEELSLFIDSRKHLPHMQ